MFSSRWFRHLVRALLSVVAVIAFAGAVGAATATTYSLKRPRFSAALIRVATLG